MFHNNLRRLISTTLLIILPLTAWAGRSEEFEVWFRQQNTYSWQKLRENIHPPGTVPGVVVASPSKQDPDYWYHWVRDAALVMDTLVERLIQRDPKALLADPDFQLLHEYILFSRGNQESDAPASLGEPKFYVDGTPYRGPWGRPQNDGPALRAHTLSRLALYLLDRGEVSYVSNYLYRPELPAVTIIKADLEYVAREWTKSNFDLWEEVRGHHFYTRLAQWKSLQLGAILAERLNDPAAAHWYSSQAQVLAGEINKHWDETNKILRVTLGRDGGLDYKHSGLDASTVLAYLHLRTDALPVTIDQLISTTVKTATAFKQVYAINQRGLPATAIGRYPEDRYYGGNPWFLTTAAFAEFHYRTASYLLKKGSLEVTNLNFDFYDKWLGDHQQDRQKTGTPPQFIIHGGTPEFNNVIKGLIAAGDEFMERVRIHAGNDGALDEQFDRNSGQMRSARHLTWSYASVITAYDVRQQALNQLRTNSPQSGQQ